MKTFYKKISWLCDVSLLIVLGIGLLLAFFTFEHSEEAAAWRKHSFMLLEKANSLLSKLENAETGRRGYLLTRDASYLEPGVEVRGTIKQQMDELYQMTRDNPVQIARLKALSPLVEAHAALLDEAIELSNKQHSQGSIEVFSGGEGRKLMTSIRNELRRFIKVEDDILAQRDARFHTSMQRLFVNLTVISGGGLLIAVLMGFLLYRESQRRLDALAYAEAQRHLEMQRAANKQLELSNAELKVKEEKLAVTLNSIGDAVMTTDAEGRVTNLNPLAELYTGWSLQEARSRPIADVFNIINQETRQPAAIPVMETLKHGIIKGLANHTVLIARDGKEYVIADSCAPIHDLDGKVIGAVLVFRDVTQEYAAQQALNNSAARIQTLLDTVVDGILTVDERDGMIETVNHAVERIFGYSAVELIGQNFSLLIPELKFNQGKGSLGFYSATDEERTADTGREVEGRRKDGSSFPIDMAVSEMWLGGQHYFTCILRDITVRKRIEAEQALLEQRLRDQQLNTRSLIESNVDALATIDPLGIIADVNQQMELLTGCSRDELIGTSFKNYFTDPNFAEAVNKRVLNEKKLIDYELTARARNGAEKVVSINAATFYDRSGKLLGIFAAARDVTERKRFEQKLYENNIELEAAKTAAEKANLAKSDFLSRMSHELRTPLNAILGFAQLLEAGSPPPTAIQSVRLHEILKAGWYLLDLINEILDLAVIESGKVSLSQEPLSIIEIMHECQTMIEPEAKNRGIQLSFHEFDCDLFVMADRTRMKQVLINLLSNAIKYNREQGKVEVKCSVISPERIRISITDTGEGITPEMLGQLFQPFNRLGQENGAQEGTGIGLVVTRQLVELMGGTIGVESTVGVGSEFWIELIRHVSAQSAHEKTGVLAFAPHYLTDASSRTLLYVEDNPANLLLVEHLVSDYPNIRLLQAKNGKLGIELARTHQPDMILMDINLPGLSGMEALKILREDPATAHIPIVALSANAMFRDIEKSIKAGFFKYLTKPIKLEELMNTLNEAVKLAEAGSVNSK
ncbi:Histidine kinase [Candidatus Methylobacter favarea]|uniref:histidine kinase n=1 Tax=Candidatus Methylobacter favarea TaxID=2707345 RepID=A0A8S0WXK1_9GAMM|nr:PAS domain S-box protein [Candidatus Methylobacter favarea]CAA9888761.1 Histidine kinase [Candidatus Methylobacter favarea]